MIDKFFFGISEKKTRLLVLLLLLAIPGLAQEKESFEILEADYAEAVSYDTDAQRLVGNQVKIKHKDVLMWCDTAYTYTGTNKVDAFGNVRIKQGDSLNIYAQKVYYNGDISFARAIKDVILKNKSLTLYSDTVDYDLARDIGYYDDFGKIVDSTNVLTSIIGKYFVNQDIIHFYKNVEGHNDDYNLKSDTLIYHTDTEVVIIVGPTTIKDSANTLYAEDGWYNTKTGEAELKKNPVVFNEKQQLKADYIKYNETNGSGNAIGSVWIHDFENSTIVTGMNAVYNDTEEIATVTDSALLMIYSDQDTLFLHADTLRTVPDTVEGEKLFKTYYDVRFYRSDIQGICDSLVYFSKDSVVQLYKNPVIWSDKHQLSADMIMMKQKTDAPDEIHMNKNSFIISKQDSGKFDQIKGKDMIGYVVDKKLKSIDVDGNGQTLYYAREKEKIIGINKSESSNISILFRDGEFYKITFLSTPIGKLTPLLEVTEEEKTLNGFDWKVQMRPVSKYDVFNRKEKDAIINNDTASKTKL